MPETANKATSTRDPKALSPEYHKAHKQLMLWATILLIWEFIGVDLGKAKDVGGYIGPIVTALKSPQAVPWVLLALVIYFLFKCSTEWAQCHEDRRKLRFARADFVSAWFVALAAIALYLSQAISRVQVADIIQSRRSEVVRIVLSSLWGFLLFLFVGLGVSFAYSAWRKTGRIRLNWLFASLLFIPAVLLVRYFRGLPIHWRSMVLGLLIGVACNVPIWLTLNQTRASLLRRGSRIPLLSRMLPKN